MTVFFAATAAQLPFTVYPGVWVDSPASVLNELLIEQSGEPRHRNVRRAARPLHGPRARPRRCCSRRGRSLAVVVARRARGVLGAHARERGRPGRDEHGPQRAAARGPAGVVLDWVDTVVPDGERPLSSRSRSRPRGTRPRSAGGTSSSGTGASRARTSSPDGNFTLHAVPAPRRWRSTGTGGVAGNGRRSGLRRRRAVRLALPARRSTESPRTSASSSGRSIGRTARMWATRGLEADGWARPGAPATIRVYGPGRLSSTSTCGRPTTPRRAM